MSARSHLRKVQNFTLRSQLSENKSNSNKNLPLKFLHPVIHRRFHYISSVQRALEYIRAGDIYQVNLAQYFDVSWNKSASELYLRMRKNSPAAYGVFLGSALTRDQRAICSISPELFLKTRAGSVTTRPIKGTRPRGTDARSDDAARNELAQSEKERAELNMIVDLERNDLGRVCSYGTVKVDSSGEIETLPTLLHRTATVSGRLLPHTSVGELLAATFPGGSITGAPKLRAMQIIAELESVPRGPYCGAIGWIGTNGDLELNIAIRTAICDEARGTARYFAGSGIVADSDPEKEFDETLLKSAAFFRSVEAC